MTSSSNSLTSRPVSGAPTARLFVFIVWLLLLLLFLLILLFWGVVYRIGPEMGEYKGGGRYGEGNLPKRVKARTLPRLIRWSANNVRALLALIRNF